MNEYYQSNIFQFHIEPFLLHKTKLRRVLKQYMRDIHFILWDVINHQLIQEFLLKLPAFLDRKTLRYNLIAELKELIVE